MYLSHSDFTALVMANPHKKYCSYSYINKTICARECDSNYSSDSLKNITIDDKIQFRCQAHCHLPYHNDDNLELKQIFQNYDDNCNNDDNDISRILIAKIIILISLLFFICKVIFKYSV